MLSATRIRELFELLNARLAREDVIGELYLVGGAVMTLVFGARPSTNDIDAVFAPTELIRRLAREVALDAGVDAHWLNDVVKGLLGDRAEFSRWLELDHLRIFTPLP